MTAQTVAALVTSLLVVAAAVVLDVHCLQDLANAEFVYRLPPRTWACLIVIFTPTRRHGVPDAGPAPAAPARCLAVQGILRAARRRSGRLQDREVLTPGANRFAVLLRHRLDQLAEVVQVVHRPGGQELGQAHRPERRVDGRQR